MQLSRWFVFALSIPLLQQLLRICYTVTITVIPAVSKGTRCRNLSGTRTQIDKIQSSKDLPLHPLLSFIDGSCNPHATGMPDNAKKKRV